MPINEQVMTVRVFFAKTMRAKYVSHLDTMRAVTRALKRSGLPVWHTQGFNPHVYITFTLPISLGYEGECESFDIKLTEEIEYAEVETRLGKALPPGFSVIRAAAPEMDAAKIKWADYDIRLIYENDGCKEAIGKLEAFNRLPAIEVKKHTKKGESIIDIRPNVLNISQEEKGNAIEMTLRCAAGISLNINPTLYLKAFYAWSNVTPEGIRVRRTAILDENLCVFC